MSTTSITVFSSAPVARLTAGCAAVLFLIVAALLPVSVHADESAEAAAEADDVKVGWIVLDGTLRESPVPFAWVPESEGGASLGGVLDQLAQVRDGEEYPGVVVFLDQPSLTLAQCTAIADAMKEVSAAGKKVMTFAEAYDLRDYVIAAAADEVLLQRKGSVELVGIAVEEMYLAGMLEKIGVKPDLLQIGKFKGADEALMRTGPSEPWNENYNALLDGLYEQTISRIAEGREMTRPELESLMADSWTMTDDELLAAGAVDRLVDRDLVQATEAAFGTDFAWDSTLGETTSELDTSNPFALFTQIFQEPQVRTRRPTIAVVHADGPITSGESSIGDGVFSSDSIGSETMVNALEKALLDDHIKGVVLRLDSPGGSALASEVIWQSLRELAADKPVFAVVGSMAASGGYYIVSGADQIYVQPHSILGSIGVVGGKITLGGLYDWAGLNVVRRTRGPSADLFNSVEPFTEPQRAQVRRALQVVYDQFIDRVETGRGDRLPDVSQVAQGRLFVGVDSVANGMADRLGGVDQALADLASQLELEEGDYDIVHLPGPMSLNEYLNDLFGVRAGSIGMAGPQTPAPAFLATARRLLGPVAWRSVSRSLHGLMLLQDESVLTVMPQAIVIR